MVYVASIMLGALAIWKLQDRTAQVEEVRNNEPAALAANENTDQAQELKDRVTRQAGIVSEHAETIIPEDQSTKLRKDERGQKTYPNLRKINLGENAVNQLYLDSFRIDKDVLSLRIKNTTASPVKPNYNIILVDKDFNATESIRPNSSAKIRANESRTFEHRLRPNFGPPVYYSIAMKQSTPPIHAPNSEPAAEKSGEKGHDADELTRIEEAFKRTGISRAKREAIFRELCLAELRAIREADKRYPLPEFWRENLQYHDTMTPKYERQVHKKYHINEHLADLMSLEAFLLKWPLPRY
jgi:hypothetical protein